MYEHPIPSEPGLTTSAGFTAEELDTMETTTFDITRNVTELLSTGIRFFFKQ